MPEDETRYIIYQAHSTGRLHCYCPIAGSIDGEHSFLSLSPPGYLSTKYAQLILLQDKEIDGSGSARPNTPLAITYVGGKAYLYFVDTSHSIRVLVRNGDKWSDSKSVQAPSQVDDVSQLTVVSSAKGNHVLYIGDGQGKRFRFSHALDKI